MCVCVSGEGTFYIVLFVDNFVTESQNMYTSNIYWSFSKIYSQYKFFLSRACQHNFFSVFICSFHGFS